ncbi:response regulator transcription factor [Caulobacter mirabilis]|uniref:Response regulator n=1 Tax=Caulobacter mirabilis TaxID=69666 RepID=A0A2D2B0U3_9CAUL|nr:response regulator [Caulobacter mirabilis]ATQ43872.1 response regulator [Caulobacter mirabilis]
MSHDLLISVVEDDPSLLQAMVGLVESLGYRAAGHASAEAFLAAGDLDSDCIITDIQMPGLSGIELKHRLVELGATTPVIMVTARTEPGLLARARESGPTCLLQKPFSAEALIGCLKTALRS